MSKTILVFNAGSSGLKFALFKEKGLDRLLYGNIERVGLSRPFITYQNQKKKGEIDIRQSLKNHYQALEVAFAFIAWQGFSLGDIRIIGHRVVHGGDEFWQPTLVNKQILQRIAKYNDLAPLHNPVNLAVIEACQQFLSGVKNVACFDTEWYKDLKPENYLYAIPLQFYQKYKIRRYGFHGLSHQYVAQQAAKLLRRPLAKLNLITCHLGSGASVSAVRRGRAIACSMGFTPLSGLPMSSRSGDLDANIPLYLIEKCGFKVSEVFNILNTQSGWRAIAGTGDFRQVMVDAGYKIVGFKPRRSKQQRLMAKLVLDQFIAQVKFYIGGYAALLGRTDAVVFTGGIGERNPHFLKLVTRNLKMCKGVKVLQIATDEELMIAQKVRRF